MGITVTVPQGQERVCFAFIATLDINIDISGLSVLEASNAHKCASRQSRSSPLASGHNMSHCASVPFQLCSLQCERQLSSAEGHAA